jgi:glycosyltransferase involved in cell wall biosynthesis
MSLITTIIPVFNRADIVARAIDSVLAQELPPGFSVKVVVVDDASSDDLAAALGRYGNDVICVRHARNSGAAAARNSGMTLAADGYVAFLDSDDVWLPGKLKVQLDMMRANRWPASCTAYYIARPGRSEIVSPLYKTGTLGLADFVWGCFTGSGSTLICTRAVLDEVGPLDAGLRRLEDWDWLLRYGQKHELGFIAEPLTRVHPSHHQEPEKVLAALAILRAKHMSALTAVQRRHFLAGMELELAAAHYRRGNLLAMIAPLLKSLIHSPTRNDALAVVLHNRG